MVNPSFRFFGNPCLIYGPGEFGQLPDLVAPMAKRVLVVTGSSSLERSGKWDFLNDGLKKKFLTIFHFRVSKEPSPELIDRAVSEFRKEKPGLVVAIGGGSVIDAGKAISAMLPQTGWTEEYLDGLGPKKHNGAKVPFIAIPTTAGTGSEATQNAVLSRVTSSSSGKKGFKKSLRHDNLIPNVALIDPELALSCPPGVTAACGMDAFTQLLESYLSPQSSVLTDTLALRGMDGLKYALIPAVREGGKNLEARSAMAYGAYLSGLTLANAGLGVIHGFASSVGGYFDIPHGVICGTLAAACTGKNIERLKEKGDTQALEKYGRVGMLLQAPMKALEENLQGLLEKMNLWTETLGLSRLRSYGVHEGDLQRIASETADRNNPVVLTLEDKIEILRLRL